MAEIEIKLSDSDMDTLECGGTVVVWRVFCAQAIKIILRREGAADPHGLPHTEDK